MLLHILPSLSYILNMAGNPKKASLKTLLECVFLEFLLISYEMSRCRSSSLTTRWQTFVFSKRIWTCNTTAARFDFNNHIDRCRYIQSIQLPGRLSHYILYPMQKYNLIDLVDWTSLVFMLTKSQCPV